ncbi:hypothetical protein ANN_22384 [Periplaneta americana]|uniref:Uncharacterized protein n=1 Tax=Periplaneta americana TaxID=6978 RepID=A0ABQ8S8H2_PERAM|nr:hypothetical protein ANN_22384 [Periplaneta americana]
MAGLCEGGNEPLGSLKANELACCLPTHTSYYSLAVAVSSSVGPRGADSHVRKAPPHRPRAPEFAATLAVIRRSLAHSAYIYLNPTSHTFYRRFQKHPVARRGRVTYVTTPAVLIKVRRDSRDGHVMSR